MLPVPTSAYALAVLALTAVPSFAQEEVDVVIVGGGISGLSAAKDVAAAGKSFKVLEARDRVGGRVWNVEVPQGGVLEVGGTFLGPTQDRALALADELGLGLSTTYDTGLSVFYQNGRRTQYNQDLGFPLDPVSLVNALAGIAALDAMAKEVDPAAPWTHPRAAEWDGQTFRTWIDKNILTNNAKFLFEIFDSAVFSTEPSEISLLYVLSYVAAAGNETTTGNSLRLISTTDGAQQNRVVGGTQLLATKLVERLGSENILLNQPVERIEKTGDRYTISSRDTSISAKQVIVAMSPTLAARIDYFPQLPAARDQLTQRMPMGSIGKAIAIYSTPFWRNSSLNGQALSDEGVVRTTFDISPADLSYGALMGFIEADEMRKYDSASEETIKAEATKDYIRYFGPQAADVKGWIIQRWDNERYSRGGPVAYGPPGLLTQYGPALRTSVDGIHFAGTETSEYWQGYIDGAVRAGERAAEEVIAVL